MLLGVCNYCFDIIYAGRFFFAPLERIGFKCSWTTLALSVCLSRASVSDVFSDIFLLVCVGCVFCLVIFYNQLPQTNLPCMGK